MYGDAMTNTGADMNNSELGRDCPFPFSEREKKIMVVRNKELGAMLTEELTCAALLMVWVILKDGKLRGRITSRRPSPSVSSCVVFKMFTECADSEKDNELYEEFVYGYEHSAGFRHASTENGITEILMRNRNELKVYFGIEIPERADLSEGRWEKYFRRAGYDVISVF